MGDDKGANVFGAKSSFDLGAKSGNLATLAIGFDAGAGLGKGASGAAAEDGSASSKMVTVTSWAPKGTTPDLNPGRWVMLGKATDLNFKLTGLSGGDFQIFPELKYTPPSADGYDSITGLIPASKVGFPTNWEIIKCLLGQRIIKP
jgi:hypothetical protein